MINQPELGKKIAELRKVKGLTQEELVDKCNISVRTLQRIEAGEVTPRNYTVKLIFEALDYCFDNSLYNNKGLSLKWLEQFYKYFINLFNLKTNTMKKISILTILLSAIILGISVINSEIKAQNNDNKKDRAEQKLKSEDKPKTGMYFSFFTCKKCFHEKELMIGRDVELKYIGVNVKASLILINQNKREFNLGAIKGKFLNNKVELSIPNDLLLNGSITYNADKVEKSDEKILLKGNAKLTEHNNEITSEEIILVLR